MKNHRKPASNRDPRSHAWEPAGLDQSFRGSSMMESGEKRWASGYFGRNKG